MSKRVPGRGRRHKEPTWDHTGTVPSAIGRLTQPGGVRRERCEQRSDTIRCRVQKEPLAAVSERSGGARGSSWEPTGEAAPTVWSREAVGT